MVKHRRTKDDDQWKWILGFLLLLLLAFLYMKGELPCAAMASAGAGNSSGGNATPTPLWGGATPPPTATPFPYTCDWIYGEGGYLSHANGNSLSFSSASLIIYPPPEEGYYCGGTCRPGYVCSARWVDDNEFCDCYNPETGGYDPDSPERPFPTPTPNLAQPSCNAIESFMCTSGWCPEGQACMQYTNEIEEDYCACTPSLPCESVNNAPMCNGWCARGYVCIPRLQILEGDSKSSLAGTAELISGYGCMCEPYSEPN